MSESNKAKTSQMNQRSMGGGAGRRGANMRMPGQKMNFGVLKRVLKYMLHYKARCLICLVCIILNAVVTAYSAMAIGTLIDDYIVPMALKGVVDTPELLGYILKVASIFLIGIIANFANMRVYIKVTQGILRDIRNDMFAKMQTLPVRYFDDHTFGDVMSHFTNDTDTLRQLISQTIPQTLAAAISILVTFVSMLVTSVWLTLFVLVCIVGMSFITSTIAKKSGKNFIRQQECLGSLNGFIEEMINGQRVVKVFTHEQKAVKKFDKENEALCEAGRKANGLASTMGPLMNNLGHLQYVLIAILGVSLVALGVQNLTLTGISALTLGEVVAFLQLSKNFTQTVNNIAQQMNAVVMAMAGAKRVFELMDEQPEENEGKITLVNAEENANGELVEKQEKTGIWAWKRVDESGKASYVKLRGDVRMNQVRFSYVEGKEVLKEISLYAKPGQKLAFVGSTGAGKTTITNLINRFYDIQEGEITYDGIPIREIDKFALRHSLGIVLQDVNLFTGTIRENIRYGNLAASDEEVYQAARLANADDFIRRLPDGYDTIIDGNGSQLSQGQRQLISIARAAIQDPPVMILDEATSSIDTRTEALVQRGMDELMKGRTVFVIAHRLSTVQNSNAIMVLEDGRIIERGDHDELIAQKGKYYQLYTGAFELE